MYNSLDKLEFIKIMKHDHENKSHCQFYDHDIAYIVFCDQCSSIPSES